MPIVVIRKASGEVKKVAPVAIEPAAPVLKEEDGWEYTPVAEAIDLFCGQLKVLPATEMGLKTDVWIASYLGFGSKKAHDALRDGIYLPEWPRLIPWFTCPDVGDWILPEEAIWEIHRAAVEGGYGGWATLKLAGQVWEATAKTPWAAFAICLLQARKVGAFKPRRPPGEPPKS
jgi:hypothetical protein